MVIFMTVWTFSFILIYIVIKSMHSGIKNKKEREIQEKMEKEKKEEDIYLESIKPVAIFTVEFDEISTKEDEINEKVSTFIRAGSTYDIYNGYKNSEIEDMSGEKIFKYQGFYHSGDNLEIKTNEEGKIISVKVFLKEKIIGVVQNENIETLQKLLYTYPFHTIKIILTDGPYKIFDYVKDKVVVIKSPFGYKLEMIFYKNDPTIKFEPL